MGWSSALKGISGILGNVGHSASKWVSSTKWGNWLKLGTAGGVGYVIYDGWNSVVSSVSDATGISEDSAGSLIFAAIGIVAIYLIVTMVVPKRDDRGFVYIDRRSDRDGTSGYSGGNRNGGYSGYGNGRRNYGGYRNGGSSRYADRYDGNRYNGGGRR